MRRQLRSANPDFHRVIVLAEVFGADRFHQILAFRTIGFIYALSKPKEIWSGHPRRCIARTQEFTVFVYRHAVARDVFAARTVAGAEDSTD